MAFGMLVEVIMVLVGFYKTGQRDQYWSIQSIYLCFFAKQGIERWIKQQ